MKAVFADTLYWVALTDPADPRYREAVAFDDRIAGPIILTTDEVLSEFLSDDSKPDGEADTAAPASDFG